ncbi:PREDICTED: NADH dehydrogenase [ubiquinone] 1 alpha subcomplex subunit 6 [Dufourea novaeangliae]|uniref:NADH dehydrogenase [ubiquinone] 1 alpha subcomplex subunit 6 n=1 Tax=Dufourea novaeangliae TaxID=178035 RepID=A0A154PEM7_DUFNO|nr:PREDICTED: NADH dehydrogenase [ubiquinone] 1 alpha subcomplex subunit 6 [Dufourea novaeangliae]KZC09670.1 NADH dehydrogenase [ubiquinone] 1 alpha subcomplex subunit 6 [Dufourea novaeangliae]
MATPTRVAWKKVKPILSLNQKDAHRRVLLLYKAWYRQIPQTVLDYDIPKTENDCRAKLKEEFKRHANITDVRVIDLLVIKGQMKLQEVTNMWIPKGGLMNYWQETWEPKPKDFLSKFLSGQDSNI